MEFYEAINKRRTTREFLDKEVGFEIIKRILEAGNKAPTWNHNRNWQFIVLRTEEEKEYAFDYAKKPPTNSMPNDISICRARTL